MRGIATTNQVAGGCLNHMQLLPTGRVFSFSFSSSSSFLWRHPLPFSQVRHLKGVSLGRLVSTIFHLVVVLALGSVPMLLLNLPVGLFARGVANKHMAVALAGSNVKVWAARHEGGFGGTSGETDGVAWLGGPRRLCTAR